LKATNCWLLQRHSSAANCFISRLQRVIKISNKQQKLCVTLFLELRVQWLNKQIAIATVTTIPGCGNDFYTAEFHQLILVRILRTGSGNSFVQGSDR